jgi:hypothetical protein
MVARFEVGAPKLAWFGAWGVFDSQGYLAPPSILAPRCWCNGRQKAKSGNEDTPALRFGARAVAGYSVSSTRGLPSNLRINQPGSGIK